MKKHSHAFTQGGQTELHNLHMLRQVLWSTFKISVGLTLGVFVLLLFHNHGWKDYYFVLVFFKAMLRVSMSVLPNGFFDSSWVAMGELWREVSDYQIVTEAPFIKFFDHTCAHMVKSSCLSLGTFVLSFLLISLFWVRRGKKRQQSSIIKGFQLMTPQALRKATQKKPGSGIKIHDIPLPSGMECQHMMITGTTGSGKSNAIHSLLLQIRALGHKAVIVDTTGELIAHFYQSERDQLLNALDQRGKSWNLWKECAKKSDFEELASYLIPQGTSHDPIWTEGPRHLFSECAMMVSEEEKPSIQRLLDILLRMPLEQSASLLRGTLASAMSDPKIEKAALSFRMILASQLKSFAHLQDEGADFSIRHWVENLNNDGWLFLGCLTNQRALMSPLLSLWFSIAVKALMGLEPDPKRRIWFIIDELGTLQKLPILLTALAEVRKYGGCFVVGFQDVWQLEETYGKNITHSLAGLTGTKWIFRTECSITASRMSEALGDQEVLEASESISYGAHQMRDGVNLSGHRVEKPVVSASDIMQLPNLSAYLKLSNSNSIAKIDFPFIHLSRENLPFLEKPLLQASLKEPMATTFENALNSKSEASEYSVNKENTMTEAEISE